MKVNKKDLALLYELDKDSRQSLSQIAKKLKTSQQVISYNLQQLQKNKTIQGFYTIINFAKLGYSSYRTMIKLGNVSEQVYNDLINYIRKHSNILWLVECGGRWDLIINILAKNPVQYNSFLLELKNNFKDTIQDYDLLLTIEGIYFGRDYLIKKQREPKKNIYFGKKIETEKLDKLDLEILNAISENARLNSVKISNNLDITNKTVINRIKELKKKGIIQGFKSLIHLNKINYAGYKALIKLHSISKEQEKKIFTSLSLNNNVIGILRMIGRWDLEVEFEAETREDILKISRYIKTKFKTLINEFEVIPLFHEYKYNFFPGNLLQRTS